MAQFVTFKQAAARLQVSERFLRRLHGAGKLRVIRIGRRVVRIPLEELRRLEATDNAVQPGETK